MSDTNISSNIDQESPLTGDNNPEFDNKKENTMKCTAVSTTTRSRCKKTDLHEIEIVFQAGTVYLPEALPATHAHKGGWLGGTVNVCGTHVKVLKNGKALQVLKVNDKTEEEMRQRLERQMKALQQPIDPSVFPDRVNDKDPVPTEDHYNGDLSNEEEVMKTYDYDKEQSQKEQLKLFEGQPFDIVKQKYGGNLMIERCDHEDCMGYYAETVYEAIQEICCGDLHCQHYTAVLCLHHEPKKQGLVVSEVPGASENGRHLQEAKGKFWMYKQYYKAANIELAKGHMRDLLEKEYAHTLYFSKKGDQVTGSWVYWTTEAKPKEDAGLATRVSKAEGTTPLKHVIKANHAVCGNCRKQGREQTHEGTTEAIKACYLSK